jgi:hypothetical protein
MLISVVSVVIAILHGGTMERMAQANARLVAANSWPFLQYSTSNQGDDGKERIRLSVSNVGVGPALIETFEVWWKDTPVDSPGALLAMCCDYKPAPAGTVDFHRIEFSQSLVASRILRAGDEITFLVLPKTDESTRVWERLNSARVQLKLRACFCSVFNECSTSALVGTHATRVDSCPTPRVPFGIPGTEALRQ